MGEKLVSIYFEDCKPILIWNGKNLWFKRFKMQEKVELFDYLIPTAKASYEESDDKPRQHLKKQRHPLADKGPHSQSYVFSSSDVWK